MRKTILNAAWESAIEATRQEASKNYTSFRNEFYEENRDLINRMIRQAEICLPMPPYDKKSDLRTASTMLRNNAIALHLEALRLRSGNYTAATAQKHYMNYVMSQPDPVQTLYDDTMLWSHVANELTAYFDDVVFDPGYQQRVHKNCQATINKRLEKMGKHHFVSYR